MAAAPAEAPEARRDKEGVKAMGEAITVHVIDDDELILETLSALLGAAGYDVQTYASAGVFLDDLPTLACGCVITDVQMPEMSGLQLLRRLQDRLKDFPTIVMTGHADVPLAVEALKTGASDFIEKPIDGVQVLRAVRVAAQGLVRAASLSGLQATYVQRIAALTARERDVLRGLMAGGSNKVIARDLGLSPRTVEAYRATLMTKMHAANLSELIRMALQSEALM